MMKTKVKLCKERKYKHGFQLPSVSDVLDKNQSLILKRFLLL
jgi:hypothetical protein